MDDNVTPHAVFHLKDAFGYRWFLHADKSPYNFLDYRLQDYYGEEVSTVQHIPRLPVITRSKETQKSLIEAHSHRNRPIVVKVRRG